MDVNEEELTKLFGSFKQERSRSSRGSRALQRLKFICDVYCKWILAQKESKGKDSHNFYDFFNKSLGSNYNLDSLLRDFRAITDHTNAPNMIRYEETETQKLCQSENCYILQRNYRDRSHESGNDNKVKSLYFIGKNNDDIIPNLALQEMMDNIHCFMDHTLRISPAEIERKTAKVSKTDKSANESYDIELNVISELINQKQTLNPRLRNINRFQNGQNKFMTSNERIQRTDNDESKSDLAMYQSAVYDNNQLLIKEEKKENETKTADMYSNGFRFWYWPFYKNNKNEKNILFEGHSGFTTESNPGYLLCDWFIACIYGNLKEECLKNTSASLSVHQWNVIYKKAAMKLQSWKSDANAKRLLCNGFSNWSKFYGIRRNAPILLEHIIAILLYCNLTTESYEFSRTYRKIQTLESDESLKKRHSQFGNWGKRLREAIDCYGLNMGNDTPDIKVYYHGVSSAMIFKSTTIRLMGPVSTTLDFMIASTQFAADGIVLNIQGGSGGRYMWNCTWWSDFSHEQERLFLGGLLPFFITTIRNIPKKKNFEVFVTPMAMFSDMIMGCPTVIRKPLNKDLKVLRLMINDETAHKYVLSLPSAIDPYMLRLFHHFAISTHQIWIGLRSFGYEQYHSQQSFGFQKFQSLFFVSDKANNKTLNIHLFLSLFVNLKEFYVFNDEYSGSKRKWVYKSSLEINPLFDSELIKTIKMINAHKTLSKSFERLIILDPILKQSRNITKSVIDKYNKMLSEHGWEAVKIVCGVHLVSGQCETCLCIKRK